MKRDVLIDRIRSKFNLNAVPSEEWDGTDGGIWIRDDICREETDYYPYAEGTMDMNNVFNKFLRKAGWSAEPYDGETIFIWR